MGPVERDFKVVRTRFPGVMNIRPVVACNACDRGAHPRLTSIKSVSAIA
jgi:hypothetical protein